MEKYLLFEFEKYYPLGGWLDFKSDHKSIDEAKNAFDITRFGHDALANIVDSKTGKIVAVFDESYDTGKFLKTWLHPGDEEFEEIINPEF